MRRRRFSQNAVLHEIEHLVGLVADELGGNGWHRTDPEDNIMYPAHNIFIFIGATNQPTWKQEDADYLNFTLPKP